MVAAGVIGKGRKRAFQRHVTRPDARDGGETTMDRDRLCLDLGGPICPGGDGWEMGWCHRRREIEVAVSAGLSARSQALQPCMSRGRSMNCGGVVTDRK